MCRYSLKMQHVNILVIAVLPIKFTCQRSSFLFEVLQYPIFFNAASLENTCTGSQNNIFGAPSINIVLYTILGVLL